MKLSRPCACGGKNPNCFRCGGWGYLGENITKSRGEGGTGIVRLNAKSFYLGTRLIKNRKPPKSTSCPYCTKKVSDISGLVSHVRHSHTDKLNEFIETPLVEDYQKTNDIILCRECFVFVKKIERHLIHKHKKEGHI